MVQINSLLCAERPVLPKQHSKAVKTPRLIVEGTASAFKLRGTPGVRHFRAATIKAAETRSVRAAAAAQPGSSSEGGDSIGEKSPSGSPSTDGVSKGAQRGAAVYGVLAVVLVAGGVSSIAAPQLFMEKLFTVCGNEACGAFMRLAGVFVLPVAVSLWTLKSAAENGRLGSATYQRLNLGLLATSLGLTAVAIAAIVSPALATTNLVWGDVAVPLLIAASAGHVLARGESGIGGALGRLPSDVASVFKPTGAASALYALLTAVSAAMAAGLICFPASLHGFLFSETSSIGPLPILLKRYIGVLLLMATTVAFCLKDAADRSRLGGTTFKLLNMSYSFSCVGSLAVLLWYVQNTTAAQLTAVAGCMFGALGVFFAFCGFQGIAASK
mmetsp:Transcript_42304/g.100352  ORF Transcript_42304/g.100352 Transcript_42304/m.100352 type:complete len:385 (-) Transcript_42304:296-1450(-)|eukprot:CAMPEP_0177611056 /NCGR_PEP_ID=MMETSP0419_2-20121207/20225_1 /TAXON_ID=582737 /ORGANISM="Tetraselmis sp., Strain GSL018" /LENGTH=384 /DNA_ID=CAMNT_0019106635 /DNA_START=523 /DNA_END=1677 /DNA_ORIENTATION=-